MRAATLDWWSVKASSSTSHRVEHQIPSKRRWVLLLGAAWISACAAPGDVGGGSTYVTSPVTQTPGGSTGGCPGYVNQNRCPPFTTGGPYTLSGVLTVRTTSGSVPAANAGVGGFVIMTNGNGYGMAPVTTDANGRYQFSNMPSGTVVLYPGAPHAYQPCAEIATITGANAVKDVELLDSAVTRPATAADSPTLSGVVYRRTAAGKEPIAGAVIEFEYPPVTATTAVTDAQGRYSLCKLPLGRGGLDVWLNGVSLGGVVVNITGDAVLDLNF